MNLGGRIFGLRRYRPGVDAPSSSGENRKASFIEQTANLRAIPPLFIRRDGTGSQIGISIPPSSISVAYPCRVVEPLRDNEPMTTAQLDEPVAPNRITYRITPDPRATGPIPPGVDFAVPLAVRYGRPFEDGVKIKVARAGSLCFVSSSPDSIAELWILDEVVAVRPCAPSADPPPIPAGFAAGARSVSSVESPADPAPTSSDLSLSKSDPTMPSSSSSSVFSLDANVADGRSPAYYVGDADYVTLSGLIQAATIKAGWLRDLAVYWSPDGLVWTKGKMLDPGTGTKSTAKISADGFIQLDVREGIAWVRCEWDGTGTLPGTETLVNLRWSKKRGATR